MRICVYLESASMLARTGIGSAVRHHLQALRLAGIPFTTDPHRDYQLLHLHWVGLRSLALLARCRAQGLQVVLHAHSTDRTTRGSTTASQLWARLGKPYMNSFYQMADQVVAPSVYTRDLLRSYGIRTPISVISNGVDRARFQFCSERREAFRARLQLRRFTVFGAGQVIARKGIVDFIEAARRLPELDFIWYGHRLPNWMTYHRELIRAIEARPANVRMPGFIADTVGAFSAGDVLFFPSYEENQPVTLLEVASLGRPMILREIPAYEGWLQDGVHCLKRKTLDAFVSALEQLAGDEALRDRLSREAQALAEAHRLEEIGAQYRELYAALLERPARVDVEYQDRVK